MRCQRGARIWCNLYLDLFCFLQVCVSTGPHLRGNVYVSFKDKEAAAQAFAATNGRFYGGKQVTV
jgi:hypothetical protein